MFHAHVYVYIPCKCKHLEQNTMKKDEIIFEKRKKRLVDNKVDERRPC